jgi:hypothetical protein
MAHRILHYYWIATRDANGKPYLVKGGPDESTARLRGMELLAGADFEIKDYPTTDLSTASSYHRGKRLESTHSLALSGQRIGHERSVKRHLLRNRR